LYIPFIITISTYVEFAGARNSFPMREKQITAFVSEAVRYTYLNLMLILDSYERLAMVPALCGASYPEPTPTIIITSVCC
jgi:hypothetical protein